MTAVIRSDALGPMGIACRDIRVAGERFADRQAAARRAVAVLRRSDDLLDALEGLNLRDVRQVPDSERARLDELMAALPARQRWPVASRLSPSLAIEVVFDIQESLLCSLRGVVAGDDERLEMAS